MFSLCSGLMATHDCPLLPSLLCLLLLLLLLSCLLLLSHPSRPRGCCSRRLQNRRLSAPRWASVVFCFRFLPSPLTSPLFLLRQMRVVSGPGHSTTWSGIWSGHASTWPVPAATVAVPVFWARSCGCTRMSVLVERPALVDRSAPARVLSTPLVAVPIPTCLVPPLPSFLVASAALRSGTSDVACRPEPRCFRF